MVRDAVTIATGGGGNPQNVDTSILRIAMTYNTQGQVEKITSYDAATAGSVVNEIQRVYNGLGQMTREYQEHAGSVNTSTSLHVNYAYSEMAFGTNHSRLLSMTYPNGKVLTYNYASGLDDDISRLSSIAESAGTLETYAYLGFGTVVIRSQPETGFSLTYVKQGAETNGDAGDPYTGLDRFGRVQDQRWINGSGMAVDRYQYSYDRNGNRLTKENVLESSFDEAYT